MTDPSEFLGPHEAVFLKIEGETIKIAENYEVVVSILKQPASFSMRLGWTKNLEELRQKCQPGKHFELLIGVYDEKTGINTLAKMQSGRIDRRAIPKGGPSVLEVKGRDYLAQVYDSYILEEQAFAEKTYLALTRKVLDTVGLSSHTLETDNTANRALITSTKKSKKSKKSIAVDTIETGATSGQGRVVYQTLKAKLGTTWYQFLKDQYKLAGLFLWCKGDGNFILGQPDATTESVLKIIHKTNATRNYVNEVDRDYIDDTTSRHSKAVVYGRSDSTKGGPKKVRGEFIDTEMVAYGFDKPIVLFDEDAKTTQEAEYIARRTIADERREGWKLDYTIPGHITPCNFSKYGFAVWGPDLVCRVDDDELVVNKDYYIESVTYSRKPETLTTVSLMRREDLVFADKLF